MPYKVCIMQIECYIRRENDDIIKMNTKCIKICKHNVHFLFFLFHLHISDKGKLIPLVFGHMSNLILNVFSTPPLPLKFIPYLKNFHVIKNINKWTNIALILLMWHPSRAFLVYVAFLHVIL